MSDEPEGELPPWRLTPYALANWKEIKRREAALHTPSKSEAGRVPNLAAARAMVERHQNEGAGT